MDAVAIRIRDAETLRDGGRLADARAACLSILELSPERPEALRLLGTIERAAQNPVEAIERIGRALFLAPDLPGGQNDLAGCVNDVLRTANQALLAGGAPAADTILSRAMALLPHVPELRGQLAAARFVQGRDAEARSLCAQGDGPVRKIFSGVLEALDAETAHRAANAFIGTIVIPAYNAGGYILRTLESVVSSIGYYREKTGDAEARFRLVVVDDGSRDGTADLVGAWAQGRTDPQTIVLRNSENKGAGASRNLGCRLAVGRYIWFLDSDDLFFPPHLYVGAQGLEMNPSAGFSRTGMHFEGIDAEVTPEWRQASEFTYPCNICIRTECHDLVGGFPEERPFCPYGPEDVAYSRIIGMMFLCAKTSLQTVHYTIREGNVGHTLKARLQGQGEQASPASHMPTSAKDLAVELFILRRFHALCKARPADWDGPPIFTDSQCRVRMFDAAGTA